MKKIIANKLYDTDTAKEVGSMCQGSPMDFNYIEENLYRKRTGEYFLYGAGGPMTRYAKTVGQNQWTGGEQIIPLSYNKAREWAEANMAADDYQAEFGPVVEESADRTTMTISLPVSVADKIRRAAQESGLSVSAMIASKF